MINPEMFEGIAEYEFGLKCPLTASNLKDKGKLELARLEALKLRIEACRGHRPIGNYLHFALNWGDPDVGYGSYINE